MKKNNYNPRIDGINISPQAISALEIMSQNPQIGGANIKKASNIISKKNGNLYRILYILEKQGFIEISTETNAPKNKVPERYSTITPLGRLILDVVNKVDAIQNKSEY